MVGVFFVVFGECLSMANGIVSGETQSIQITIPHIHLLWAACFLPFLMSYSALLVRKRQSVLLA